MGNLYARRVTNPTHDITCTHVFVCSRAAEVQWLQLSFRQFLASIPCTFAVLFSNIGRTRTFFIILYYRYLLSNVNLAAHLKVCEVSWVYAATIFYPRSRLESFVRPTPTTSYLYSTRPRESSLLNVCRESKRTVVFDSFGGNLEQIAQEYAEPYLERYYGNPFRVRAVHKYKSFATHEHCCVCVRYAILMRQLFSLHEVDSALRVLKR